jgi:hypothetical protein
MPQTSEYQILDRDTDRVLKVEQPESNLIVGTREDVNEVVTKMVPETSMPLRLTEQSYWHGKLLYSAHELKGGAVRVILKVELSPDPEEDFDILLSQKDLQSQNDLKELFRSTVVDGYVFKNKAKKDGIPRKGLTVSDMPRFAEMAANIISVFRK